MTVLLPYSVELVLFFLHLMVPSSNCAVPKSYVTVLLSRLVVHFFFLANDGSIVILCSTNITFDRTFLTFGCTLFFFSHI